MSFLRCALDALRETAPDRLTAAEIAAHVLAAKALTGGPEKAPPAGMRDGRRRSGKETPGLR
jgi:hypothetical protein